MNTQEEAVLVAERRIADLEAKIEAWTGADGRDRLDFLEYLLERAERELSRARRASTL